jgi:serpin B
MIKSELAVEILNEFSGSTPDGNVAISPINLYAAMNAVRLGAAGETLRELTLALEADRGDDAAAVARLAPAFREATSVWVAQGVSLSPTYSRSVREHYCAITRQLPPSAAAAAINAWVSEATEKKIPQLVDAIKPGTALVLVTAAYFRAKWQFPFNPRLTHPKMFRSAGTEKRIPFMTTVGEYSHVKEAGFEWIRLPYTGTDIVMDIVVPADEGSLSDIGTLINHVPLERSAVPGPERGRISMPKFSVSWHGSLSSALRRAGLNAMFDPGKADFSPMLKEPADLAVDDVVHSLFIAADEEGTEAAAATAVTFVGGLPAPHTVFDMTVDRPFLLLLRASGDQSILFMAIIRDPSSGTPPHG